MRCRGWSCKAPFLTFRPAVNSWNSLGRKYMAVSRGELSGRQGVFARLNERGGQPLKFIGVVHNCHEIVDVGGEEDVAPPCVRKEFSHKTVSDA